MDFAPLDFAPCGRRSSIHRLAPALPPHCFGRANLPPRVVFKQIGALHPRFSRSHVYNAEWLTSLPDSKTPPLEGGHLARHNGEAGSDGGETPPLQTHGGKASAAPLYESAGSICNRPMILLSHVTRSLDN